MTNPESDIAAILLPYCPRVPLGTHRLWSPFLLFTGLLAIPYLLSYSVYRLIWFFTNGTTFATRYLTYHDLVTNLYFRWSMYATMFTLNLLLLLPFLYFSDLPIRSRLALRKPYTSFVAIAVWTLGSVALAVLTSYVSSLLNIRSASLAVLHALLARSATEAPFPAFFMIAVFGPIGEEILFRGYIQTRLVRRLTPFWGILLTSILFGIFHRDWGQGLHAAIVGAYLGAVSYHSGSILPSLLCHMAINTSAVLLAFSHQSSISASFPVITASSIIVLAACYLLAKTAPPGSLFRMSHLRRGPLVPSRPHSAYD